MSNINKDYNMKIANSAPPNKYGAYPFSVASIRSLPKIDLFIDNYSNEILNKACIDVLTASMQSTNQYRYGEIGRLVSILDCDEHNNTMQHINEQFIGGYEGVQVDDRYKIIVSSRGIGDLVFIHNHPNNSTFSGADLEHLYTDIYLYGIVAVGNRHNTFIVTKSGSTARMYNYIQNYARAHAKSENEVKKYKDLAALNVLKNPSKFNIEYHKFNRRKVYE